MRPYQVQLRSLVNLWLVALVRIVGRTDQVFITSRLKRGSA